jgi:hypothetical protein
MRQIGEREQKNSAPATHALVLPKRLKLIQLAAKQTKRPPPAQSHRGAPVLVTHRTICCCRVVDASTTSLRTIMGLTATSTRTVIVEPLANTAPPPQPQTKFSTHPCALISLPQMHRCWQAAACPRAAHKTVTYRCLRSPTGSADAIGWHNSNLKVDLGLHCGCLRHPQIDHARASGAGALEIFTKESTDE